MGLDRPEGFNCDTVLCQSEIPSINKEEKEKCFKRLDANYENEHKCDRAEIETIEPKSIKRIAYKMLKRNSLLMGSMGTSATLPRLRQLTLIAVSVVNLRIVRD